jgi:MoxR-like ATPase
MGVKGMGFVAEIAEKIVSNVERVVKGKREAIQTALVALLADGHILIEDVPGVAKTMLARALAISIGCQFSRIQCTPDLLPSDLTGVSIFNQKTAEFEFRPGPLMANIVLSDEINRATPRTQAALLEAMAERQITVDGVTRKLPKPFLVMATQNPVEFEGTFPLPEAQLDRFLLRMAIGYPAPQHEHEMLISQQESHPIESLEQQVSADDLIAAQAQARKTHVSDPVRDYIIKIVAATRQSKDLFLGASPRASQALFRTSQAAAALLDRDFVLPDDAKSLAHAVLEHRIIVNPELRLRGRSAQGVVEDILKSVPAPVVRL